MTMTASTPAKTPAASGRSDAVLSLIGNTPLFPLRFAAARVMFLSGKMLSTGVGR